MKSCVVRVPGPAVAKLTMPRVLCWRTGSSGIRASRHTAATCGSPWIPNCAMNPRFFRVITGFMAQFGIHGDPQVAAVWRDARIPDDPVRQHNTRGMVSFATAGPGTRTTQLFINYGDNSRLDGMGFSPFGRVVEGMDVVERFHAGYGEGAPSGRGPDQSRFQAEGNAYLKQGFPELDYVTRATIVAP